MTQSNQENSTLRYGSPYRSVAFDIPPNGQKTVRIEVDFPGLAHYQPLDELIIDNRNDVFLTLFIDGGTSQIDVPPNVSRTVTGQYFHALRLENKNAEAVTNIRVTVRKREGRGV